MHGFTIENSALVLVDHQVGTINWTGALEPQQREHIKVWANLLLRFAKGSGMPIVMTSSMEDQAQGPLLPEFEQIAPQEYAARIKRDGVINAWDDVNFANAVRATQKTHLIMAGLTTEICLVPPALAAIKEGFKVAALLDASGGNTQLGEQYAERELNKAGALVITSMPLITSMLGNWTNPASGAFFSAAAEGNIFELQAQGHLR
ncbi:MAG: isochorismatase family protein [Formosimonas sp.]